MDSDIEEAGVAAVNKQNEPKVPLKIKAGDYQVHIYLEEARGIIGEDET